MPKVRVAAALVFAVLLAGCGGSKDETPAAAPIVTRADLPRMLVPKQDLGALAWGLNLDRSVSGRISHNEAAEDTVDPRDTGRGLARAGRLHGYDLTYSASRPSPSGVVLISQGIELFRTEEAASATLKKHVADYMRFRGRTVDGIKLARVEEFDVDAGDEANGLRIRAVYRARGITVYSALAAFRRGRVVGHGHILLRRELGVTGDVDRLVGAMDDRVRDAFSAKIPGAASSKGTTRKRLDPKSVTLGGKDLPVGTALAHQGHFQGPGLRAYLREYDVLEGRLAGSRIFYARTMAQVFETGPAAARNQKYMSSASGANSITRRFLGAYFAKTGFTPRGVTARPLHWRAGDTAGIQFFFRAPKGRVEGVLLSVVRGRATGSVLVMGLDQHVKPGSVLTLRQKLRGRLRGRTA